MSEVSIKLYGMALKRVLAIRSFLERLNDRPYTITAVLTEAIDYFYLNKVK